jgi:hypothetical protein
MLWDKGAWFSTIRMLRHQLTKVKIFGIPMLVGADGNILDRISNLLACQRSGFSSDAEVKEAKFSDCLR